MSLQETPHQRHCAVLSGLASPVWAPVKHSSISWELVQGPKTHRAPADSESLGVGPALSFNGQLQVRRTAESQHASTPVPLALSTRITYLQTQMPDRLRGRLQRE